MRLFVLLSLLPLMGACSTLSSIGSAEKTWFQDWSCERPGGVCARTDQIDRLTISEIGGDPAEAGPISGYPIEAFPEQSQGNPLKDVQPMGRDELLESLEGGEPFLTSYGEATIEDVGFAPGAKDLTLEAILKETEAGSEPGLVKDVQELDGGPASQPTILLPASYEAAPTPIRTQLISADPEQVSKRKAKPAIVTSENVAEPVLEIEGDPVATLNVQALEDLRRATRARRGPPTEQSISASVQASSERQTRSTLDMPVDSEEATVQPVSTQMASTLEFEAEPVRERVPLVPQEAQRQQPTYTAVQSVTSPPAQRSPNAPFQPPARRSAKLMPVVISPFVDAQGIFHEKSVIWIEVEAAGWVAGAKGG